MQWEFIVALVLAIPVILLPVALVWYVNVGGIHAAIQDARKRQAARKAGTKVVAQGHPAER